MPTDFLLYICIFRPCTSGHRHNFTDATRHLYFFSDATALVSSRHIARHLFTYLWQCEVFAFVTCFILWISCYFRLVVTFYYISCIDMATRRFCVCYSINYRSSVGLNIGIHTVNNSGDKMHSLSS